MTYHVIAKGSNNDCYLLDEPELCTPLMGDIIEVNGRAWTVTINAAGEVYRGHDVTRQIRRLMGVNGQGDLLATQDDSSPRGQ